MHDDASKPRSPRLAVVDDDESVRESLPALLRCSQFEVFAFSSAEEFLTSDELAAVDCLILDVAMPNINGLELQIELDARDMHIPIVFMTARVESDTCARLLETGAVDCLLKPFSAEALLHAVDEALKVSRGA